MPKPEPKPIDPGQLLNPARAVIDADRFPYLATTDGDQPRLRPVSPVRTDGFTAYLANLRQYHKTAEPAANPKVAPCYIRIKGLRLDRFQTKHGSCASNHDTRETKKPISIESDPVDSGMSENRQFCTRRYDGVVVTN